MRSEEERRIVIAICSCVRLSHASFASKRLVIYSYFFTTHYCSFLRTIGTVIMKFGWDHSNMASNVDGV